MAGPATVTYTTGSLIAWVLVILIGCAILCFISYRSGYRNGESRAVRDIASMEQRPLKQRLNGYRRARSRPNVQDRNRSK